MKKIKIKQLFVGFLVSALTISSFSPQINSVRADAATTKVSLSEQEQLQRKIVGYFPEWAYKSEAQGYFKVTDLQWDSLTHIQYSFAMVDPATNKITFGDKKAAIEETFNGMNLSYKGKPVSLDSSLPYKGHFNLLQVMKKQYPNVKLLMSVGGWGGSRGFYTMLDSDAGINTFADSCVEFAKTYGFDGVDIDFEYPSSTSQSGNPADFDLSESRRKTINERYNVLIKTLREKFDAASVKENKPYLVTAAVTASSWVLGGVSNNEYAKYLDFLSVMSYDFHGGWNEYVENLANIYSDPADRETAQMLMPTLSMDWAYRYYRGVLAPEKILMGIPYYTRGWENVQGGTNGLHGSSKTPATGKYNVWGDPDAAGNIIPAGANPLWHVMNLMDQDSNNKKYFDPVGGVPHVWNDKEKVFLSFEDEQSIAERVKYIKDKNLGGALIWVMNGDYGLNPNYKAGSTNINEGKYTFGSTLTDKLKSGLNSIGSCTKTNEGGTAANNINVDVKMTGVYDHPNYTYTLNVTNYTKDTIPGGWTVSFDLPNSAVYKSSWGGTYTTKPNGDFTTVTLTAGGWQSLAPNATVSLQGMIGLCFSGIRNVTFNGMNAIGKGDGTVVNSSPILFGVNDVTINKGATFNPLAGVTATDKEDGDLTSKITVDGTVDITKAGSYNLSYSVADSKGSSTTAKRIVTVVDQTQPNTAPTISGVSNKTINVGDSFNPLTGVTATDKEDGNLTSSIKVTGTVDTTKAGTYNLSYSVTDKGNLTTTASCTVTVVAKPTGDTYDATKVYLAGNTIIYNGQTYKAKWWVQGGATPDKNSAWELVVPTNPDGSKPYISGTAYNAGDKVSYNGKLYKANWWTTSIPGSDSSWSQI